MPADREKKGPACPDCGLKLVIDRETGEWVCIFCGRAWKPSLSGALGAVVTDRLSKTSLSERRQLVNRVAERFGQEKAEVILRDAPELKEKEDLQLLSKVAEQFGPEKVDEILKDNISLRQKWDEFRKRDDGGLALFNEDDGDDGLVSSQSPSGLWYLCPFFFGIIGGLVAYVAVRDRDRGMATSCLVFGFAMVFVEVFVLAILFLELYR